MKIRFFGLAFFLLSSFSATAGTPDQDPVILNLRERFRLASLPQAAELLKHTYGCTRISSVRGYTWNSTDPLPIKFKSLTPFLVRSNDGVRFTSNSKEWVGRYIVIGPTYSDAIRMEKSGNLIIEVSANALLSRDGSRDLADSDVLVPISEESKGWTVNMYSICIPQKE
jgi:hypothetical protein